MNRKDQILQKLRTEFRDDFIKDTKIIKLVNNFYQKALYNLEIAQMLVYFSEDKDFKIKYKLRESLRAYDWTVIVAYYAMFHIAQSAIAKKGYKCKTHETVVLALDYLYSIDGKLEKDFLDMINKAKELEQEYVNMLRKSRELRVSASYDVSAEFSKEQALIQIENAKKFVNRLGLIIKDKG